VKLLCVHPALSVFYSYGYYRILAGNLGMLKVEPTSQHGRVDARSGQMFLRLKHIITVLKTKQDRAMVTTKCE